MTYDQLDSLGIDHKWLGPLEETFAKYDISTPQRQAAFIGLITGIKHGEYARA